MKKKSWFGILFKVIIIVTIFTCIHSETGLTNSLSNENLSYFTAFEHLDIASFIRSLNLVNFTEDKTSLLAWGNTSDNEITINNLTEKNNTNISFNGKKILIYNTHQHEDYANGGDVVSGAKYLEELLEGLGYEVIVEDRDFHSYLINNGYESNEYYNVSKVFLEENLINEGPFDLIIDFHRDAANKNVTTLSYEGINYAKIMFVVGKLSSNNELVKTISANLSNELEKLIPGITRNIYYSQSYFNQQVTQNMILIEIGAQYNTYEEVKSTLDVFAKALDNYMKGE